jgi:hypothetical protein
MKPRKELEQKIKELEEQITTLKLIINLMENDDLLSQKPYDERRQRHLIHIEHRCSPYISVENYEQD